MSKAEIDGEHRILDDYVLAELVYDDSKTCCWNSTNREMYDVVMAKALADEEAAGQCIQPAVFRARNDGGDGFEAYRQFAESQGQSGVFRAWSADESCPQASVSEDTEETKRDHAPMCELQ